MTTSRYVSAFLAMVLFSSATAPAFVRSDVRKRAKTPSKAPTVAKNLPTMKGIKGGPGRAITEWNSGPAPAFPTSGSLLDETGHLSYAPKPSQVAEWRKGKSPQDKLFLAELTLGIREPAQAEEILNQVINSEKPGSPTRGLARRAKAFALHCQGRYREATTAFKDLRRSNEVAIDRRDLRIIEKHSFACAGYHTAHAKLGIPQAGRIDPLSGIRSVAKAITRFGKKYDEAAAAKVISHDGMGTQGKELKEGIEKLEYSAFAVKGQAEIVKHLPLPLVAFVEHDHYVAVTKVTENGVSMWCVDCGGERPLTWKQWGAMDAEMLIAIVEPNSDEERMLEAAFSPEMGKFASLVPVFNPYAEAASFGWRVSPESLKKGALAQSAQCDPCEQSCPMVRTHCTDKPVNVATGAEEYEPEPDLVVYNPEGPDVSWGRLYMSAGNAMDNGFGDNWSHSYNLVVNTYPVQGPGDAPPGIGIDIVLPSSAHIKFGLPAETSLPDAEDPDPIVLEPTQPGRKMKVTWKWDSGGSYDYFEIEDGGQNVIRTTAFEYFDLAQNFQWPNSYVREGKIYRIQSMADAFGKAITFHYANYSRKVVMQENYGQTSTWTPTVKDLQYIKDGDGDTLLTLNYVTTGSDPSGRLASVQDRYDRKVYYTVPYHASQLPSVSQAVGTPAGVWAVEEVSQIVESSYSGTLPVKNQYGYELVANGKLGEAIASLETISVVSPTGSGMSTATLHYDTDGSIIKVTDANGYVIEIGQHATLTEATITHKTSGGTTIKTYKVEWDNYLNLTQVRDADNEIILTKSFTNSVFKPTSVKDAYDHEWTFEYDEFGNMEWSNTPRGIQTTYDWDYDMNPLGRLMEVSVEGKSLTTEFTYYSNGKVETIQSPNPNHDTGQPDYVTTEFTYNGYGDILTVESPGNNAESVHTTTYDYGSTPKMGQPLSITNSEGEETEFAYDDQGNVEWVEDPLGNVSETTYNFANQPDSHTLPETGTSGSGSAFSVTTYLFPGGIATGVLSYDEGDNEGPIRTVTCDYGSEGELLGVEGDTELSTRTYDAAYNLKTLTDGVGSGLTTTYTYNTKGPCTEIDYPGATGANFDQIRFTYNKNGQVTNREDGNNVDTVYVYDEPDGGLTKIDYASGTDTEFDYDDYGRVTLVTDATGTSSSNYDEGDFLQSSTRSYPALTTTDDHTFTYGYYRDGSRRSMVYTPSGTWTYEYDKVGRYTSMGSPAGTVTSDYDANGRQTTRTLPNGAYTNISYNAVGVPTAWTNKNSSNTTLSQWGTFDYDGVFNLTAATSSNNVGGSPFNGDIDFTFDSKDRLTEENSTRFGNYDDDNVFDAAGNPTTFRDNASRTYNGNNQRSNTGYTYDGNGNPTTYATASHSFDKENRLTGHGSTSYDYRSDGLRAWQQTTFLSSTEKRYYLYDQGNVVCELNTAGSVVATNVYAPDGLVGRTNGTTTWQYLFDWQGNAAHGMTSSSTVSISSAFTAWGQRNYVYPFQMPSQWDDCMAFNARWGYLKDASGYYYCQNRYYDPANGRWLTRDPIGTAGGINIYGYCASGPVGWLDSDGLDPIPGKTPPPFRVPGDPFNEWKPIRSKGDPFKPNQRPWKWVPKYPKSDGGKWNPNGSRPSTSWDPVGQHWDTDDGNGNRTRQGEFGDELTPEQAHNPCPELGSSPEAFWRADNPWAWAAGLGVGVLAVGAIIATGGAAGAAIGGLSLGGAKAATAGGVIIIGGGLSGGGRP